MKCERPGCQERAVDWHHRLSRTKGALKRIGKYLIDHPKNGIYLCHNHHSNLLSEEKWSEREFFTKMGVMECYLCKKITRCGLNHEPLCCKEFDFDSNHYYKCNNIDRNKLIPGSYKYKE
jgi:hypothetical protein